MASSGWQGDRQIYGDDSSYKMVVNIHIDGITRSNGAARVWGTARLTMAQTTYAWYYRDNIAGQMYYNGAYQGDTWEFKGWTDTSDIRGATYDHGFDVTLSAGNTSTSASIGFRTWDTRGPSFTPVDSLQTWTISFDQFYGAPNVPSVWNLTSDGTPHQAHSKVQTASWGTNSSRSRYEVLNASKTGTYAYDYDHDPGDLYWTLPNGSNDINACAVIKWYGRATNNHALSNDSGAAYIATPSAPAQTITAGSGINPGVTISATPRYKGGTQNSSTCDNGTLQRWQMAKMTQSQTGLPSTFQLDSNNDSSTTKVYTWDKSQFDAGVNYKFMSRVTNNYGGTSSLTSNVIYCPTGVSGTLTSKTTKTLTFRGGYNYAGDVNVASAGTISCYQLDWGDSADNLNHTVGPQTSNTFTVSNLTPNQTVYYRVTAWNVYGLSNVSNVNSATTIPRYDPVVSSINFSPQCPGADVAVNVSHTGGLTEDELTVTSLKAEWKPANSSAWTTLAELTGLNVRAGQTYTMENVISSDAPEEGDYHIRITASNGTDTSESIWVLSAPTGVVLTSVALVPNQPIQIRATATMSGELAPYKYTFRTEGGAGTRVRTFENTDTSITVTSPNYLLYDTEYTVTSRVYNQMGLWRQSAPRTTRTDKRVHWYFVTPSKTSEGSMTFATRNSTETLIEKPVADVYYVVANALGDITSARIGENMNNKRLHFISETLHYRPENVASITFTNGKKLAYDLDASADTFKFGIWNGNTIETTFFDGVSWLVSSYDFPNGYTISAVSAPTDTNLNASSAFSTTSLTEIPLPERGGN